MAYEIDLSGKVALVTGASSGLGARFARVLAQAGATVALAARRVERLKELRAEIDAEGGEAHVYSLDVTDVQSVQSCIARVESDLKKIDILVNNSGVSAQARVAEVTEEDYDYVMNTNLKGAFFVAQQVGKVMIDKKTPGRVINIASVAGMRALSQLSVYCISKAAVIAMTKSMALEWGRYGINVNAICPGYIETEINSAYFKSEGGQKLMNMLPRRRLGQPDDLDGLLLLLAGDASGFVNGAVIAADDGLSVS
ncbi:MAG TPA: SDR family oxidoreductase [Burkholderiales bacterium]|jgi:NAD(P)-dependent dehydrogenase (short-subunit alcohol dehydrogenase family)